MTFEEVLPEFKAGKVIYRKSFKRIVYWYNKYNNQCMCDDTRDVYRIGMFGIDDVFATDWVAEDWSAK